MIKANEVYINKWYYHDLKGIGKVPEQMTEETVGLIFSEDVSIALQDFYPIPLSREILESNCGFTYNEHGEGESHVKYWELNKLTICDWGDGLIMSNSFSFSLRVKLTSLHQLQILYYCLTEAEAEIKNF